MMVETQEIMASRGKTFGYLALGVLIVVAASMPSRHGNDDIQRYLCLMVFGPCTIFFALRLVWPERLALDQEGFTLWRGPTQSPRRIAWQNVVRFFIYNLSYGGRMIAYELVNDARADGYASDLARRKGVDGFLPKTLPGSPDQIVANLNAYRAAALNR